MPVYPLQSSLPQKAQHILLSGQMFPQIAPGRVRPVFSHMCSPCGLLGHTLLRSFLNPRDDLELFVDKLDVVRIYERHALLGGLSLLCLLDHLGCKVLEPHASILSHLVQTLLRAI